jgi:hypothetical protein
MGESSACFFRIHADRAIEGESGIPDFTVPTLITRDAIDYRRLVSLTQLRAHIT